MGLLICSSCQKASISSRRARIPKEHPDECPHPFESPLNEEIRLLLPPSCQLFCCRQPDGDSSSRARRRSAGQFNSPCEDMPAVRSWQRAGQSPEVLHLSKPFINWAIREPSKSSPYPQRIAGGKGDTPADPRHLRDSLRSREERYRDPRPLPAARCR